jgi:quercetin dioxygenase-like cupin family protein
LRKEIIGVEENNLETGVAHIPPGEGRRSLWVMGEMVTCKITSDQTSGAYSLFEITTQPGDGPPPHVQHWEDESFYVLEGDYEFLLEGHTKRAGVGSLIYVPRGTLHTHKNVGDKPGTMLVSQTPGGAHERFFEEAGKPVDSKTGSHFFENQPDVAGIGAIAAKYGIEISVPMAQKKAGTGSSVSGRPLNRRPLNR